LPIAISKTALILGSSGLVGGFCLQSLLRHRIYQTIISVVRRERAEIDDPRLVQKAVNFDQLASLALPPIDDVFCALGTTIRTAGSQEAFRHVDVDYPLAAAHLGLKFGAKQFVLVSSVGADPASKNFYLRCKGELERNVAALPFQAVHILRPSLLMGHRAESRPAESFAIGAVKVFQFLFVGPLRRYHPISAQSVGNSMVSAALSGRQGVNVDEYDQIIALSAKPEG
jgi:uncharacterized protein YbjT (DUF2867 family)